MAQASKAAAKPSVPARMSRWLNDVRAEMRRVVWPSRPEVINSSGIVIVTLLIFVILIAVYDLLSYELVHALSRIGG